MRQVFPGVLPPSIDFQAVKDGRRSRPFYVSIALDVSRSIANGVTEDLTDTSGKALILNAAGNSLFSDPIYDAAGTYIAGVIVAHHQDDALGSGISTPITLLPNSAERIPFTRIILENFAQAGKVARLVYGVDIDFVPGFNAQATIGGIVSTREYGMVYGASFGSIGLQGAATSLSVFSPASNVNGAIVWAANIFSLAATIHNVSLLAKSSAPGTSIDGDVLLADNILNAGQALKLPRPILVAAGKGLYIYNELAETRALKGVLYTLL